MTAITVNGVERTERQLYEDYVFEAFAKHGALDVLPHIPTKTLEYFICKERKTGEQVFAVCCRTRCES